MKSSLMTRLALCSGAAILFAAAYAGAHVSKVDLRRVVQNSEAIVFGEVTDKAFATDSDGNPWTQYTIRPIEVLGGSVKGSAMTVRCFGGPVEGGYVRASGTPAIEKGQRWLLFYDSRDPFCELAGWEQGAFQEVNDGATPVLIDEAGVTLRSVTAKGTWERGRRVDLSAIKAGRVKSVASANAGAPVKPSREILSQLKPFIGANGVRLKEVTARKLAPGKLNWRPVAAEGS